MTGRVLLVEDDERLGSQIVRHLLAAGFDPRWVKSGNEALDTDPGAFELIILDLMLPGAYGLDVLKRFRAQSEVPVLILSARNDSADKVKALQLGADDFVTKPYWPAELLERVRARIRRPTLERRDVYTSGDLRIDVPARTVELKGECVDLTKTEFDILAALARRQGSAITREWMVEHCLAADRSNDARALSVHVSRLRRKLGAAADRLATVWGVGYRLDEGIPHSRRAGTGEAPPTA